MEKGMCGREESGPQCVDGAKGSVESDPWDDAWDEIQATATGSLNDLVEEGVRPEDPAYGGLTDRNHDQV